MKELGVYTSDYDINQLMRRHVEEREVNNNNGNALFTIKFGAIYNSTNHCHSKHSGTSI